MKNAIVIVIVFLAFILFSGILNAQEDIPGSSIKNNTRKNSVYGELGGTGPLWSINYDRIVPVAKNLGIVLRGGLTYDFNLYPLGEFNLIMGGTKNFFELGLGTYARRSRLNLATRVGYRLQTKFGLLIRVAYVTIPYEFI